MLKPILIISLVALAASCSVAPKKPGILSGPGTTDTSTILPTADASEILSGDADGTPLSLLPDVGSSMRFLDARALTNYYSNVFPQELYGYDHCKGSSPSDPADCTSTIFTKDERPSMGTFDLGNPNRGRAGQNVNPAVNLTLNYMRTLRAALSRECNHLVELEEARITAKDPAKNILWKGDTLSAATLIDFEKRLLGLSGSALTLNIDADSYVKAFDDIMAATAEKSRAGVRKIAYQNLCIALAMDPLVFIY